MDEESANQVVSENTDASSDENQKTNPILFVTAIVLVAVFIGGFYLLSRVKNKSVSPQQSETAGTSTQNDQSLAENQPAITVSGGSYYFEPNEIRVQKDSRVTIEFVSKDTVHDFVLDEFDVKTKQLSSGQKETITFLADKTGEYEFYCSIGNHRRMGMAGKLIVTE